jgi:hypothetical protein
MTWIASLAPNGTTLLRAADLVVRPTVISTKGTFFFFFSSANFFFYASLSFFSSSFFILTSSSSFFLASSSYLAITATDFKSPS